MRMGAEFSLFTNSAYRAAAQNKGSALDSASPKIPILGKRLVSETETFDSITLETNKVLYFAQSSLASLMILTQVLRHAASIALSGSSSEHVYRLEATNDSVTSRNV